MADKKKEELPVHQLGRNDEPISLTPKLDDSKLFPGMHAVVPDGSGYYRSSTRSGK